MKEMINEKCEIVVHAVLKQKKGGLCNSPEELFAVANTPVLTVRSLPKPGSIAKS